MSNTSITSSFFSSSIAALIASFNEAARAASYSLRVFLLNVFFSAARASKSFLS